MLSKATRLDLVQITARVQVGYNPPVKGGNDMSEFVNKTVREIEAAGGNAIAYQADIGISTQVDAMVATTLDAFGRIDILINNARLSLDGPFIDMSEDD